MKIIRRTSSPPKLVELEVERMDPDCATLRFKVDGVLASNGNDKYGGPAVRRCAVHGEDIVALFNIIASGNRADFHRLGGV